MKMTRRDFLRLSSAAAAACGVTLLPAQKADAASEIQTLLEEAESMSAVMDFPKRLGRLLQINFDVVFITRLMYSSKRVLSI